MIRTIFDGPIATIVLDRPAARNAIAITAWHALADAVAALPDTTRVVLLTSAVDGIFSAGADITEFGALQTDPAARERFRVAMRVGIEAVARAPMPVIAVVDGACFGAAVALALACDIRVAGDGARFAVTPAKLGIGYPAKDVARLIAHIGKGQASRMLFSADAVEADEARAIGLADLRAPDAAIAARALADRIACHAPQAVRDLKRVLADPADPEHTAAFDAAFEGDAFAAAFAHFTRSRS
ncbi:enoyl-CoA hydratase/isomerase family protein [Hephaestia sp. GCM10023244]|uniref:enoyl-CoA hydratase/isomerase family protein n=1 Tax=unclassified Hephaestia TaxID=2631281 RepID=UPI002076D6F9|nr:enoyl-CoA hydratase/isomerase family protein [Hephaestia sp. MAHUQ-44]MCM8731349.1 enoyl-CoA hydratase/isomerase family protein [Hephaestia sp. MAHUQ-44]